MAGGKVDFRQGKRRNPEQDFQQSLVRDLRSILPPDCFLTAFPAGGGGRLRGAILNGMGLAAGFPDLLFIHRGIAFGMELKAAKRGPSDTQIETFEKLGRCGMDVCIVRTIDEALACLSEWKIPTRIVEPARAHLQGVA